MNYFHSSGVLLLLSKSGFYNKLELERSMHVCSLASKTHFEQAGGETRNSWEEQQLWSPLDLDFHSDSNNSER